MGKGKSILSIHKKQQKKEEQKRQEKAQSFLERYQALVKEKNQELDAKMAVSDRGIQAYLVVVDTKTREELKQEEQDTFKAAYETVVQEEGIEWFAELSYTPRRVQPRLRLREYMPPQLVDWSEAQRQNLETRKECTHSLATPNDRQCEKCGLETTNWGADQKGVTEEYEARKRKEIEETKAKENEPKEEEKTEENSK